MVCLCYISLPSSTNVFQTTPGSSRLTGLCRLPEITSYLQEHKKRSVVVTLSFELLSHESDANNNSPTTQITSITSPLYATV